MKILTPDETILGLIAIHACHGYELIEMFVNPDELGAVWKMSTSQIYAVLKRLEKQAFISGRVVNSDNAPSRTEYVLTSAGKKAFEAWLHDPEPSASIRRVRVEFLSRLYIARRLNIPTIPIVARQKAVCRAEYSRLLTTREEVGFGMNYLTHELALAQLDAVLTWIERCELVPKELDDIDDED
ncbi:MAG: PadR family transcriptional regulator [Aggregatilineales bacterium]